MILTGVKVKRTRTTMINFLSQRLLGNSPPVPIDPLQFQWILGGEQESLQNYSTGDGVMHRGLTFRIHIWEPCVHFLGCAMPTRHMQ